MNALFPIKLMNILNLLAKNTKWLNLVNHASDNAAKCEYPFDGRTRTILCSPQVVYMTTKEANTKYYRIRLAYNPECYRVSRNTALELYDANGKMIKTIPHSEWSAELSLALETELLEILLNINPY